MIGTLQELLLLAFAGASLNMLQWSAMRSDINFSFSVSAWACKLFQGVGYAARK